MMNLREYMDQDTAGIRKLSVALCEQAVLDGWLVKVEHPNLKLGEGTVHPYLQKAAAGSLLRILQNHKVTLNSAYRTLAQQYVLKKNLTTLVAPIGRSNHGSGLAIDIYEYQSLKSVFENEDWEQSYPSNDPVHYDYSGTDKRHLTIKTFQNYWNRYNSTAIIVADGVMGDQTLNALRKTHIHGF